MCEARKQSPRAREDVGEAAGACRIWEELCQEVNERWRLAIEIVMVGSKRKLAANAVTVARVRT